MLTSVSLLYTTHVQKYGNGHNYTEKHLYSLPNGYTQFHTQAEPRPNFGNSPILAIHLVILQPLATLQALTIAGISTINRQMV